MIAVCRGLKAHGIKGDIKVECFTDSPDVLLKIKTFYVDGNEINAERVKPFGNFALIKFVGIDNMESAEKFRNKQMFVKKQDMPIPDDGTYYIDDLIECTVVDADEKKLGKIKDVLQYGSADVFVLRENGKTIMFPHLKKVVVKVDTSDKTVVVDREEFDKVAVYED